MDKDLKAFERNAKRVLENFKEGKPKHKRPEPVVSPVKGLRVDVVVRESPSLLKPYQLYTHTSDTIFREQAEREAKAAAAKAGWHVIHIWDVKEVTR